MNQGTSQQAPSPDEAVDHRAILYGNPNFPASFFPAPAVEATPTPSVPLPSVASSPAEDAELQPPSWVGGRDADMQWGHTHYGDWLSASSSTRRPLLPSADVQRIGESQRVRSLSSYRGPPGISHPQHLAGWPSAFSSALETGQESFWGAASRKPFAGRLPGSLPVQDSALEPTEVSSHRVYGAPQWSTYSQGLEGAYYEASGRFGRGQGGAAHDDYVLAPDGEAREITKFAAASQEYPPPPLRSEEAERWGGEEGATADSPWLDRLSPLDLGKGPVSRRFLTDVWSLCVLVLCWVCLLWLVASSLSHASPQKLTAGVDWKGRVCGLDGGVAHLPLLYWPSKQPPKAPSREELDGSNLLPVSQEEQTRAALQPSGVCDSDSERLNFCSWYSPVPARLMLQRFCVFSDERGFIRDHGVLHSWLHWVGDLALVWPLAAPLVVISLIAAAELTFLLSSIHFFSRARAAWSTVHGTAASVASEAGLKTPFDASFTAIPLWISVSLGVLSAAAAVVLLLCVLSFRRQLSLCTTVIRSAAGVLREAPSKFLLLLPGFTALTFAVHAAIALFGILHVMAGSAKFSVPVQTPYGAFSPWQGLSLGTWGRVSVCIVVFVALWTSAFISGVCQLITAYFTACCYFTPNDADRREVLSAKANESVRIIMKNHLGSAALGGLLLSTVEVLRLCLCWARRISPQRNEPVFRTYGMPPSTSFVFVALLGQPLCAAAWTAAAIQKRNPVAFCVVWQVGRIVQVVGQLVVACAVTWTTYLILPIIPGTYGPDGQLSSLAAPLIFSFLVSYNVASSCMKCFGFVALTLLQSPLGGYTPSSGADETRSRSLISTGATNAERENERGGRIRKRRNSTYGDEKNLGIS
ncbi:uncharacterized protein LOC113146804 [Cyclospora cayetanensis]|uniref:Uncharacterized protein LOC113146804 n=1 Tax=Cyclospora cayetanensis TaxID=88456 RepID=A0A6P6RT67_9EIME|nr:uncharacterized protein LOC113146804 [Cyclospora cayetanensis]